jgi:hypothetical protein
MAATFRCLQSGQTVTFTLQHDIDSMRGHAGYVRIDDAAPVEEEAHRVLMQPPEAIRRPGRPRKIENVRN